MEYREVQLTHEESGHTIHHAQVFSSDNQWIVFDGRNDDSKIMTTEEIRMVNVETGEIKDLYRTTGQTEYGPGVGAATFSPVANRVIFIRGINNASKELPYGFTRRSGIAIDIDQPGKPIHMDARDIRPPFTPGALRGGTHAHGWSADGKWISFTYNDFVIDQLSETSQAFKDLRQVGVMAPAKPVVVSNADSVENFSGEMFSVVVSKLNDHPVWGSDEIEKAFDECWVGKNGYEKPDGVWQQRAIAFQGHVRDKSGNLLTEIFVADLHDDITTAVIGQPLEGTTLSRPRVPKGINQRRITFTEKGVQGPRHWLRSTSDGSLIGFLAKDSAGLIQIFVVELKTGHIRQLTKTPFSVQSQFNFSPDDKELVYVADNSIYIADMKTGESRRVSKKYDENDKPTGAIVWSPDGQMLAFNRYQGQFLQIFLLKK